MRALTRYFAALSCLAVHPLPPSRFNLKFAADAEPGARTCAGELSSRPSAVLGVCAAPPPTSTDKTKRTDRRKLWQVQSFCQPKRHDTHWSHCK